MLSRVLEALETASGPDFGQMEHNTFELERLPPMARAPRIEITETSPWPSVMDWRSKHHTDLQPLRDGGSKRRQPVVTAIAGS